MCASSIHQSPRRAAAPPGHQRLFWPSTYTNCFFLGGFSPPTTKTACFTPQSVQIESTTRGERGVSYCHGCGDRRFRWITLNKKDATSKGCDSVAVGRDLLYPPFVQAADPLRQWWRRTGGRLQRDHLPRLHVAVVLPEEDARLSVVVNERTPSPPLRLTRLQAAVTAFIVPCRGAHRWLQLQADSANPTGGELVIRIIIYSINASNNKECTLTVGYKHNIPFLDQ